MIHRQLTVPRALGARTLVPRTLLAGVLFASIAVMLLAGCGSSGTAAKAADDKQVFTVLLKGPSKGDLASLDPQLIEFQSDYAVAKTIYTGLVTLDDNMKVIPDGAESWSVSADGKTYTFKIRSGIRWSDGTAITAVDFASAIGRAVDPCINSGAPSDVSGYLAGQSTNELLVGAQAFLSQSCPPGATAITPNPLIGIGKAIEAVDPQTLVLRLSSPAPYFLQILTYPTDDPVPQALVTRYGFHWASDHLADNGGTGSGPYKLVLWDHAGHAKLVRNDAYWGGKPTIREIDYVLYQDFETAYLDYKAGKGSLVYPALTDVQEASTLPGYQQPAEVAVTYTQPNQHLAPFDDLDARIAFDAAVNRDVIAHTVLHGAVSPTINYLVKGLPGYNSNLKTSWGASGAQALQGDPAVAKTHITAYAQRHCGGDVTKCPPVQYTFAAGNPASAAVAQALLQMWQTALPGYPISIQAIDRNVLLKSGATLQLPAEGWIMDYPADEDWFDQLLHVGAGYNTSFIHDPDADKLSDAANVNPDVAQAEQQYQQAEQIHASRVAWIVIYQPNDNFVVRPNVVGYTENAGGVPTTKTTLNAYITQ
jgi:peptide/nickel transport system substrate-binding protein/oligopeptide transport system substrate-binding protein